MTIHALASGSLWDSPERRQSKNGKDFVSATLKMKDGEETAWIRILAFSVHVQAELMELRGGDPISVAGVFKVGIYAPADKAPRISLTIFAEAILPLRQAKPPKAKPAPKPSPKPTKPPAEAPAPAAPTFDDGWPSNMPEARG